MRGSFRSPLSVGRKLHRYVIVDMFEALINIVYVFRCEESQAFYGFPSQPYRNVRSDDIRQYDVLARAV